MIGEKRRLIDLYCLFGDISHCAEQGRTESVRVVGSFRRKTLEDRDTRDREVM